jgi:tryptophan synthase alpha subunit
VTDGKVITISDAEALAQTVRYMEHLDFLKEAKQ